MEEQAGEEEKKKKEKQNKGERQTREVLYILVGRKLPVKKEKKK